MKNTFGNSLSVTLFGESHGGEIGAVLDGMAPGVTVDEDFIRHQLDLRRPMGNLSTSRAEPDDFRIISGIKNGKTTGTPICILIPNRDVREPEYDTDLLRPGHADYTGFCKYHGFADASGGGHFSGRLTAALVAVGAIAISALRQNGIFIGTHISVLAGEKDREFSEDLVGETELLDDMTFAVLDGDAANRMRGKIEAAALDGDSVGGILETVVCGMPKGVGEPWFDSLEGMLSHAIFSIPAVKGIAFGAGFDFASMRGSEANDPFVLEGGEIVTLTNHNGGINGGISNGMPILFRTVIKPTPSVYTEQETVNLRTMEEEILTLDGRNDPCILPRARVVVDSMTALTLCDALALRFGTDFLGADE